MTYLQARSEEEKNLRRKAILSAAKDLFYEKGYSVTVDEIGEKANLSKATLYLYFKNKDELYVAAMLEGFQGLEDRLRQAGASAKKTEEKLRARLYSFLDYMLENRKFFRMTQHYLAEDFRVRISSDPARIVEREISRLFQYVTELTQQGIDRGVFKEGLNANSLATILWRTATGLLDLAIADECADARRGRWGELFSTAMTLILDGAKAPRGKGRGAKKAGAGVSKRNEGEEAEQSATRQAS